MRGSWRPNINNFDPHSYGRQRCVFLVLLMLNRRPRGPLCWVMAFFTASYQQPLWTPTHQGPRSPSAWCGFPYHISSITLSDLSLQLIRGSKSPFGLMWLSLPHLIYNSVRSITGTVWLLSWLSYNSSTPTQSPTRSLEWHDWSSSSRNNCHAVHRSLSSGASVYECTMGIFFTSSHFICQFPLTQFPLITAIRMCHLLPVHHLGMAFLAGSKAKIQQVALPVSETFLSATSHYTTDVDNVYLFTWMYVVLKE